MNTMEVTEKKAGSLETKRVLEAAVFSELDRRFADFIEKRGRGASRWVGIAAAMSSCQVTRGHVFLDLTRPPVWDDETQAPKFEWPTLKDWETDLRKSLAVGFPGEMKPLVLTESGKLYLQRYWFYEKLLADKIREKSSVIEAILPAATETRLEELFGESGDQKEAARNALQRRFSVISGGPGTGKTTTVAKILVLLLEKSPGLSIRLAAPTGKAAARLQESLRSGVKRIPGAENVRERVSSMEASTIHRLLGSKGGSVFFRHDAKNPLAVDVVVLDEASMVDLPLMAKLFDALPEKAQLIMLGDKDQLASVDVGSVLSGIVEAAQKDIGSGTASLDGLVTILRKNYRFGNDSGIYHLCNAIRDGDPGLAKEILEGGQYPELKWEALPTASELKKSLRPYVVGGFQSFIKATTPEAALEAFGQFQILSGLRNGPYGKENLNFLVEEILRDEGLVTDRRQNFAGRALMVTENDYGVRLFNGDIGVMLNNEKGQIQAYFGGEDGSVREVSPLRLPSTETAFAMTVHKSQGSEFEEILVVLPAKESRVLTRELLYTAISRARRKVTLWSSEEILTAAISRKIERGSALPEMLSRMK